MEINLTCNNFDRMTDTNKLLYLILMELKRLNPAPESEVGVAANIVEPNEAKDASKKQLAASAGKACKYCGKFIAGNKGKYLAHVRQCPKRK